MSGYPTSQDLTDKVVVLFVINFVLPVYPYEWTFGQLDPEKTKFTLNIFHIGLKKGLAH